MKRRALLVQAARQLPALLAASAARAGPDERLLLVVGRSSRLERLGSLDLHKLYLGLAVVVDGVRPRALRNLSDPLMREVFFQSIVSMSESVYDRRMLALTLQQGLSPPPALPSTRQVFEVLAQNADAVSYAWAAEAEAEPRVRALRVLWHR